MVETLFAPDRERVVTTNAWAFLHSLRIAHGIELADWAALQNFSVAQADMFRRIIGEFAQDSGRARQLADVLLHADLRPDDTLLVVGPTGPWDAASVAATSFLSGTPAALLEVTADRGASVLVAPAQLLAEAAFQRARSRPNLANLRTIVVTDGPMSPEGRRRIYTWVKSDVLLLARTGDTFWGNPLEPVLARPPATPAFLTPPLSTLPRR